jgi:transcriptional regulator of acetoin/glycerol metabolism
VEFLAESALVHSRLVFHAAKLLGITRATLRKRIEKSGIQRELNVK